MFVILGARQRYAGRDWGSGQLATLEPGSFFGEMCLMTGGKRTASVMRWMNDAASGKARRSRYPDTPSELAQQISDLLDKRQIALVSLREKLQNKPEQESKSDLLTLIQEFFGIRERILMDQAVENEAAVLGVRALSDGWPRTSICGQHRLS